MSRLIQQQVLVVTASRQVVGLEAGGGNSTWPEWYRYLTVYGQRLYEIGNVCNTCDFYFQRLDNSIARQQAVDVGARLNEGRSTLESFDIRAFADVIPNGGYTVLLLEAAVTLVRPGDASDYFANEQKQNHTEDVPLTANDPKTPYYRAARKADNTTFFEFFVPTMPLERLDDTRVVHYMERLATGNGPTAAAISVLDTKQPWDGDVHWCLAHYVLDGHHKLAAASQSGLPITVLSFLAMDKGVSSPEDINELLQKYLDR